MSWHFSQALEAAFSEASSLGGELSAPLSATGTDGPAYSRARMTEPLSHSQSGTTSPPSTGSHGEDVLTWYLAASPARHIPRRLEAATRLMISGRKCGESWQRSLPGTYSRRTSHVWPSTRQQTTLQRWATKPAAFPFPRLTWVRTTFGHAIGYVHTPTTKANYTARSMQKWPSCRAFVQAFGHISPEVHEWLMAWPIGWSDTSPLAKDKYRSWLQRHGACSATS
jgi:hypothetical protein